MNCLRVREVLSLFAARDLEELMAREVSAHLRTCGACRRGAEGFGEQQRLLKAYGRSTVAGEAPTQGLWARIHSRLGSQKPW